MTEFTASFFNDIRLSPPRNVLGCDRNHRAGNKIGARSLAFAAIVLHTREKQEQTIAWKLIRRIVSHRDANLDDVGIKNSLSRCRLLNDTAVVRNGEAREGGDKTLHALSLRGKASFRARATLHEVTCLLISYADEAIADTCEESRRENRH